MIVSKRYIAIYNEITLSCSHIPFVQKRAQIEMDNQGTSDGVDMSTLEREFEANREKVVNMLIDNVMQVDVSIPRVVQGKFGE